MTQHPPSPNHPTPGLRDMSSPSVSIELRDRHDGQKPDEHRDRLEHAVPHAPRDEDFTPPSWETQAVEHERRVSRMLALLVIQVQFFMSASITAAAVPHTILACSIVLELFSLIVDLSFPDRLRGGSRPSPPLSFIIRGMLILPTIVGVLGLVTTVIAIMTKTCLGAAIVMSSMFILAGFVYLSLFFCHVL